jgi:ribosomal small subunit protein bTHX
MGKGDLRTRKGKVFNGSYGKKRSHENNRTRQPKPPTTLSLKRKP